MRHRVLEPGSERKIPDCQVHIHGNGWLIDNG